MHVTRLNLQSPLICLNSLTYILVVRFNCNVHIYVNVCRSGLDNALAVCSHQMETMGARCQKTSTTCDPGFVSSGESRKSMLKWHWSNKTMLTGHRSNGQCVRDVASLFGEIVPVCSEQCYHYLINQYIGFVVVLINSGILYMTMYCNFFTLQ